MLPRTNKLTQCFQDIQKFVSDRAAQNEVYGSIAQNINQLGVSLKSSKLVIQIISPDLALAEELHQLFTAQSSLQQSYQFSTGLLPALSNPDEPISTPKLILQGKESTHYELSTASIQSIGRHPSCIIQIPDHFTCVSGRHAELRPTFVDDGSENARWQIWDFSKNGTYINGERVQECQILQSGDRISLGASSLGERSAALIFECPIRQTLSSIQTSSSYQQLFNANVLCLVIDSEQFLSPMLKHFIEQASQITSTKLVLVAALPNYCVSETIQENLREVESWSSNQTQSASLEVVPIVLAPSTADPTSTILVLRTQPRYEQLCQSLESFAKDKIEALTNQRVATQLAIQIAAIESLLNKQVLLMRQPRELKGNLPEQVVQNNLKERFDKARKRIERDKDQVFRQAKNEIGASRSKLLDEFRQSSLPHKIERFIEHLQPVVTEQKGHCYIHFKLEDDSGAEESMDQVHSALMNLCQSELTQWAMIAWEKSIAGEAGISGLLNRSQETLSIFSDLGISSSQLQISQRINIQPILQISTIEEKHEARYKKISFWAYISRNIRMLALQTVGLITMVGTSIAFVLKNPEWFHREAVLLIVLPISIPLVIYGYHREKTEKFEETVERLRKDVTSYYKTLVSRLAKALEEYLAAVIDSEERCFRETLEAINEQCTAYINEADKYQKYMERDMTEVQKLKRELAMAISSGYTPVSR
jgi:FHA domain